MVRTFAAVAAVAALLPVAFAQNLVIDGDFESVAANGDTSIPGWTNTAGTDGNTFVAYDASEVDFFQGTPVQQGVYSVSSNALTPEGAILAQDIATTAGACYTFSFQFSTGGETDPANFGVAYEFGAGFVDFTATAAANSLALGPTPGNTFGQTGSTAFTGYSFVLPAAAATTTVGFQLWSSVQYPGLDSISVVPATGYSLVNGVCVLGASPATRARRAAAKRFNHGGVQW